MSKRVGMLIGGLLVVIGAAILLRRPTPPQVAATAEVTEVKTAPAEPEVPAPEVSKPITTIEKSRVNWGPSSLKVFYGFKDSVQGYFEPYTRLYAIMEGDVVCPGETLGQVDTSDSMVQSLESETAINLDASCPVPRDKGRYVSSTPVTSARLFYGSQVFDITTINDKYFNFALSDVDITVNHIGFDGGKEVTVVSKMPKGQTFTGENPPEVFLIFNNRVYTSWPCTNIVGINLDARDYLICEYQDPEASLQTSGMLPVGATDFVP